MAFQNDNITSIPAPLPLDYDRQYDFSSWEANNPGVSPPASAFNAEFNAIQQAIDETQARLRLIQRDDGAILNEAVGLDQLAADALIGVNPPTNWAETTSYAVSDTVFEDNAWYICLEAHVSTPTGSGGFATDLAASKWRLLIDFAAVIALEAENWANYPEDQLVPEGDLVDDYSALHWAAKAEDSATAAATSASNASTSAAAAATSAAAIPTPTGGDANKLVKVNGAENGYELITALPTDFVVKASMADNSVGLAELDDSEVYASQVEAEAGVETTKIMTAERVKQAIDANVSDGPIALLSTTSVTAVSSIDLATVFSANTGYDYYRVVIEGIAPAANAKELMMRLSIDGSTFRSGVGDYEWAVLGVGPSMASPNYDADNSDTEFHITEAADIVDYGTLFTGYFDIYKPNTADEHPMTWRATTPAASTTSGMIRYEGTGMLNSTSAVTGVQLFFSGTTFAAQGTIKVYGRNIPF